MRHLGKEKKTQHKGSGSVGLLSVCRRSARFSRLNQQDVDSDVF